MIIKSILCCGQHVSCVPRGSCRLLCAYGLIIAGLKTGMGCCHSVLPPQPLSYSTHFARGWKRQGDGVEGH